MELRVNADKTVDYILENGAEPIRKAMPEGLARSLIERDGAMIAQDNKYDGFPLCVDGTWHFPTIEKRRKRPAEDVE